MRASRQSLRRALLATASSQHGHFTAAQALSAGYSYQAQKWHVDQGNWERVDRGLFRLPEWPVDDDDHLARWSLWAGDAAVVSHESALSAHDLGDVDPSHVHMTVPRNFSRKQRPSVVLHRRSVPDAEVEARSGYRVTSPARAVAECAADGTSQEYLDGAVQEALERGVATARALRRAAAELGPQAELGVERALATVTS